MRRLLVSEAVRPGKKFSLQVEVEVEVEIEVEGVAFLVYRNSAYFQALMHYTYAF